MNRYYTVEKVAELLALHPKTIQRYVREGKLKAKKVGKSWRIYEQGLSDYMQSSSMEDSNQLKLQSKGLASSVVDIRVESYEEASDIEKILVATMKGKSDELGNTTMHIQYLESEDKLRVTLWGNVLFMQKIFEVLSVILEQ